MNPLKIFRTPATDLYARQHAATKRLQIAGLLGAFTLIAHAQEPSHQKPLAPSTQMESTKAEFEFASVREDLSGRFITPGFSLDSDDAFTSTGGRFEAIAPLSTYIAFAYKLNQLDSMLAGMPKWATTKRFAIRAQAAGSPTKDQIRQMMQTLLKDRFKLSLRFEKREMAVFSLTSLKPGKTGPGLRLHSDGPKCDVIQPYPGPDSPDASVDMLPCGVYTAVSKSDHSRMAGARETTMSQIAAFLSNVGGFSRPVIDQTGITEMVDFAVRYLPDTSTSEAGSGGDVASAFQVSLTQAIKDQLGLKLTPVKISVSVPVVNQVEIPTDN